MAMRAPNEPGTVVTVMTPEGVSLAERYEPRGVEDAYRLAQYLAKSGTLGGVRTPENVLAVMIAGAELGVRSMQALRSIYIIDGKPTLSADLMLALCKRSPVCRYFRLVETSSQKASYETLRSGDPGPTTMGYTWDQAVRAELVRKDNWKKHPEAMLRARCITALARAVYPDLFMGVYDPEELGREVEVQPTPTVLPAPAHVVEASFVQTPPPASPVAAPVTSTERVVNVTQSGNVTYPAGAVPELGMCPNCGGFFFHKTHAGRDIYQCKGRVGDKWCNTEAVADLVRQYLAEPTDALPVDLGIAANVVGRADDSDEIPF